VNPAVGSVFYFFIHLSPIGFSYKFSIHRLFPSHLWGGWRGSVVWESGEFMEYVSIQPAFHGTLPTWLALFLGSKR